MQLSHTIFFNITLFTFNGKALYGERTHHRCHPRVFFHSLLYYSLMILLLAYLAGLLAPCWERRKTSRYAAAAAAAAAQAASNKTRLSLLINEQGDCVDYFDCVCSLDPGSNSGVSPVCCQEKGRRKMLLSILNDFRKKGRKATYLTHPGMTDSLLAW